MLRATICALLVARAAGFAPPRSPLARRAPAVASVAAPADAPADAAAAVAAERYVVQNRFRVKKGREPAFEKRWADRESRLGTLPGFRFFCMLRRVDDARADDDVNYVSNTVWETQADFEAWRKGDAFKEAHGGGTIGGIAGMLVATAQNTKGKPKPALWEGLLPVSLPGTPPPDGEGWRQVAADGETALDGECFVAMNRFAVREGSGAAFEARFAARESDLAGRDGFKGFVLLRRDGKVDDGFTHSTWSVWRDRAAFDAWRAAEKPAAGATPAGAGAGGAKPPSLYERPPSPTFYEGILVLESAKGV